jgi:hypothetical protein
MDAPSLTTVTINWASWTYSAGVNSAASRISIIDDAPQSCRHVRAGYHVDHAPGMATCAILLAGLAGLAILNTQRSEGSTGNEFGKDR